ncbi:MAG: DNA alkylation repair protein [Patescibacteria group bacterium]|nr:DNA alkylation repair protein [Patescibacteria group bacterium]
MVRSIDIIEKLKSLANPKNVEGMARFGINSKGTLGVSIPQIRNIAKGILNNQKNSRERHKLALELWESGIHEAKLLAGFIDDPKLVTEKQINEWIKDFDSWDVCDQVVSNLFDKTPFAWKKAFEYSKSKKEFVKRTGFVLMAALSVHDKKAKDEDFLKFFPVIKREATDERNFVKKAVNWALRQIGKRNIRLSKEAIKTAEEIKKIDSKSARWITSNALSELKSPQVQKRLRLK